MQTRFPKNTKLFFLCSKISGIYFCPPGGHEIQPQRHCAKKAKKVSHTYEWYKQVKDTQDTAKMSSCYTQHRKSGCEYKNTSIQIHHQNTSSIYCRLVWNPIILLLIFMFLSLMCWSQAGEASTAWGGAAPQDSSEASSSIRRMQTWNI